MNAERDEAIHEMLAAGLSRRQIAARLGISDRLVRTRLAAGSAATHTAESALAPPHSAPADPAPDTAESAPPAQFPDFIPEGPLRVIPMPTREQRLTVGGAVHPRRAWIRCVCGSAAWRVAPGVDEWQCAIPPGPRNPHPPHQVADADGVPQLVWAPFRIKPFPGAM